MVISINQCFNINYPLVSGSFEGGGSTNISGSILSTGSFGNVEVGSEYKCHKQRLLNNN